MKDLASELQAYFSVFVCSQRNLSGHTIHAYRDAWRLFLLFLSEKTARGVHELNFEHITTLSVTEFLDYLEQQRGNSITTRNARLTAIKAFLSFAILEHLENAGDISRVLALPAKHAAKPILEYLSAPETQALVAAPDQRTWIGRRDRAWLVPDIQTGLRISFRYIFTNVRTGPDQPYFVDLTVNSFHVMP